MPSSRILLVRRIVVFFVLLPLTHICAQLVPFQTFLAELENVERIDSTSFGIFRTSDFLEQERYSHLLPQVDEECRCESEHVLWGKGSYIEYRDFFVVMLQRYCTDYNDGNSQWFMENDGVDYMLITYSRDGKVLDYKVVGHSGAAYVVHMEAVGNGLGLAVKQGILDDCSLLFQYENLVYTVCTSEYVLKPDGMIGVRIVDKPHKEVVDVLSCIEQFSFEQFRSYFKKWDKSDVDNTLFSPFEDRIELPFESCLSLIPDTLDYNCWPRDIQWIPCRYIETEKSFCFFLVKDCATPKNGFVPYTDYMMLKFYKNGIYNCAMNVYHTDDNMDFDGGISVIDSLITKKMKELQWILIDN